MGTSGSAAASQSSSANVAANSGKATLVIQIEAEIETAQATLAQLMLASGQTTGLISTSA